MDYDKQAEDFLAKFGITFTANLSNTLAPTWAGSKPHGHHYRVTLSKGKRGQGVKFGQRIAFDFWGSISDREKGIKEEKPYSVLASISGDVHCPETFKDFCSEYGYDEDSIEARKIFKRCSSFAKRLRAFFNAEEIAALSEIQ